MTCDQCRAISYVTTCRVPDSGADTTRETQTAFCFGFVYGFKAYDFDFSFRDRIRTVHTLAAARETEVRAERVAETSPTPRLMMMS